MSGLNTNEVLYITVAFTFQIVLIIHFALRKWNFSLIMSYGWVTYALSIPACGVSLYLLLNGAEWSFWLGGILYIVWSGFGYYVDFIRRIRWRNPILRSVFFPYVFLYLATVMFYWWPLGQIHRELWYGCGALVVIGMVLNAISHRRPDE